MGWARTHGLNEVCHVSPTLILARRRWERHGAPLEGARASPSAIRQGRAHTTAAMRLRKRGRARPEAPAGQHAKGSPKLMFGRSQRARVTAVSSRHLSVGVCCASLPQQRVAQQCCTPQASTMRGGRTHVSDRQSIESSLSPSIFANVRSTSHSHFFCLVLVSWCVR